MKLKLIRGLFVGLVGMASVNLASAGPIVLKDGITRLDCSYSKLVTTSPNNITVILSPGCLPNVPTNNFGQITLDDGSHVLNCSYEKVKVRETGKLVLFLSEGCLTENFGIDNSPPPPPLYVEQSIGNRTYLPGCADGLNPSNTDCEREDTFIGTEIFAVRYPTDANDSGGRLEVARTDQADDSSFFEAALSREPGDFNVDPRCKNGTPDSNFSIRVYDAVELSSFPPSTQSDYCPVTPGVVYYLNIRSIEESCGVGNKVCRTQILAYGMFNNQ